LSSFGHPWSHNSHKTGGAQVWRRSVVAATATRFLVLVSGFWFMDFMVGVLFLEKEKYVISWLCIGSGIASIIILSIKVMVLGGGCMPMVG
jgi:hypothetical protein